MIQEDLVPDRAAAARTAHERNAALRALDDPPKVARATRIVRAALERRVLTLDELVRGVS